MTESLPHKAGSRCLKRVKNGISRTGNGDREWYTRTMSLADPIGTFILAQEGSTSALPWFSIGHGRRHEWSQWSQADGPKPPKVQSIVLRCSVPY